MLLFSALNIFYVHEVVQRAVRRPSATRKLDLIHISAE